MKKSDANVPLELMNELYRSYDFFNIHFCKGLLPRPILLITQESKKKNVYGWFRGNGWNLQNKEVSEIVLHHSCFQKGIDEVFDTMLHEMAHLKNFYENDCNSNIDCTEQQRHNQIFKTAAEHFGLTVTQSKRFGFGHTDLGDGAHKAIKLLKPNGNYLSSTLR